MKIKTIIIFIMCLVVFTSPISGATSFEPELLVGNEPPIADAGGPYYGNAGENISFDGSGSYDPDGFIIFWNWTFGDGNDTDEENPIHAYIEYGNYTVTLTVYDNDYTPSNMDTTYAYIHSPPDNPIIFEENESLYVYTTDPDNDNVKYFIDWGDETTSETDYYQSGQKVEISHEWPEPGVYEIRAKAMDIQGAESDWSDPYEIVIENILQIPIIDFINLKGGVLGISVVLKNFGNGTAYDIKWEMNVSGGLLIFPTMKNGKFDPMEPGKEEIINIRPLFGFGIPTFNFYCTYKMILNSSRSEVDAGVNQVYRGIALGVGHMLPELVQPRKEWKRIDPQNFEYDQSQSPPFDKFVKFYYDVETWHNVRVHNLDSQATEFLASCKFTNGEGVLMEDWVTQPLIQNENTYWEVELVNGQ